MNSHRVGSFVLFGGGLVLVFAGLASALGYSAAGMAASGAAIIALLYAGGVWFGTTPAADPHVILFTRQLETAGPRSGRSLVDQFPGEARASIEQHCRSALEGRAARFTCGATAFAVSPVRSPEGAVVYGLLLIGRAAEAADVQLTRAV
jgi:hypothetical protein